MLEEMHDEGDGGPGELMVVGVCWAVEDERREGVGSEGRVRGGVGDVLRSNWRWVSALVSLLLLHSPSSPLLPLPPASFLSSSGRGITPRRPRPLPLPRRSHRPPLHLSNPDPYSLRPAHQRQIPVRINREIVPVAGYVDFIFGVEDRLVEDMVEL